MKVHNWFIKKNNPTRSRSGSGDGDNDWKNKSGNLNNMFTLFIND